MKSTSLFALRGVTAAATVGTLGAVSTVGFAVAEGAELGTALGSVLPGIGNVIGLAAGATVGAIVGGLGYFFSHFHW